MNPAKLLLCLATSAAFGYIFANLDNSTHPQEAILIQDPSLQLTKTSDLAQKVLIGQCSDQSSKSRDESETPVSHSKKIDDAPDFVVMPVS